MAQIKATPQGDDSIPTIDLKGLPELDRGALTKIARDLGIKNPHVGGIDTIIKKITAEYLYLLHTKGNIQDGEKALAQSQSDEVTTSGDARNDPRSNNSLQISMPEEPGGEALTGEVIAAGELSTQERLQRYIDGAMRLRRVRIYCLDPKMTDVPSEVVTVIDRAFGTVRRVIPLKEEFYVNGQHVEQCILDRLLEQQFQHVQPSNGDDKRQMKGKISMKNKFQIEFLPPLTQDELDELKASQQASKRLEGND